MNLDDLRGMTIHVAAIEISGKRIAYMLLMDSHNTSYGFLAAIVNVANSKRDRELGKAKRIRKKCVLCHEPSPSQIPFPALAQFTLEIVRRAIHPTTTCASTQSLEIAYSCYMDSSLGEYSVETLEGSK